MAFHFAPWHTLRGRLLLLALLVEAVMLGILVSNSLRLLREAMGDQARAQAEQMAPVLSAALVAPLAQYDYATVQAVLDESHAVRGIDYLAVIDVSGEMVASSGLAIGQLLPDVDAHFSLDAGESPPRYDVAIPIKLAGQTLGTLRFGLDLTRIVIARNHLLTQGLAIAGGELLLSAGLLTLLGLLITRQLSLLTEASLKVAKGQLTLPRVPEGQDDVGRLGAAFNVMSAAIAERIEQLKAIFDFSPDGFISFDAQRRVRYASPAFFRMTGLSEAEVVGQEERALSIRLAGLCINPAQFAGLAALKIGAGGTAPESAEAVGETGSAKRRRHLIELAAPAHRVLEVSLRLVASETVSQILYFRDVTHETEVDRIKSEFLSHAAHELRTPMASVLGYAEILQNAEFTAEEREEFAAIIHRNAELMAKIINELLDLARIEARGGKDFKRELIEVDVLVKGIVADFKPPEGREVPLIQTGAAGRRVDGDRDKLTQAVGNVLSNAYKYSPDGGAVEIDIIQRDEEDGKPAQIGIRITDHGMGMTPEQLGRVCERFYRADTSGKIPGTGLGMSIVKEIVELHGGEVELDSQPGTGSAVTLWLPGLPGKSLDHD